MRRSRDLIDFFSHTKSLLNSYSICLSKRQLAWCKSEVFSLFAWQWKEKSYAYVLVLFIQLARQETSFRKVGYIHQCRSDDRSEAGDSIMYVSKYSYMVVVTWTPCGDRWQMGHWVFQRKPQSMAPSSQPSSYAHPLACTPKVSKVMSFLPADAMCRFWLQ